MDTSAKLNLAGLLLDAGGAWFLAHGLILSKSKAMSLGASYFKPPPGQVNPPQEDRMRISTNAKKRRLALDSWIFVSDGEHSCSRMNRSVCGLLIRRFPDEDRVASLQGLNSHR